MRAFKLLEERFGTPHPALQSYREPHDSQLWLVKAFFRLHKRRGVMDYGPIPITYPEMVMMGEKILNLNEPMLKFFYESIEEVDEEVLSYLYEKHKPSEPKKKGR